MMDGPIIPVDLIQAKTRAAYKRGAGRDEHGFNWHSVDAIATYQAEWDRCAAAEAAVLKVKPMLAQAGANPP
jgi:hypothetical protein